MSWFKKELIKDGDWQVYSTPDGIRILQNNGCRGYTITDPDKIKVSCYPLNCANYFRDKKNLMKNGKLLYAIRYE